MKRAIQTQRLFDGQRWRDDCAVIVEQDRIAALVDSGAIPPGMETITLSGGFIAPGFIDTQVNGGGGILLNNQADREGVNRMVAAHRATGTTAMTPTLISDTSARHRAGVAAVIAARDAGNAGVLGVHIEGPFLAPTRRGTHSADTIRQPSESDLNWLASLGAELITLVTLAPEQVPRGAVAALSEAGVVVCAGHTEASFEQIEQARDEGLRGFTHLFNAMSGLTARSPGTIGAALAADNCWAGVIADGHHVHPASLRVALRALPQGKVFLVTDAMATVGDNRTDFELYGELIAVRDGKLVNAEGVLAGSAIGMIDAVNYCYQVLQLPLAECLRMASLYPATFLGLNDSLGRIAEGYRADFLHLESLPDKALRVRESWVAGQRDTHIPSGS